MLPTYTDLEVPSGLQGFDTAFNQLLALLEAQKCVEYEEVELTLNGATETAAGIFPAKRFRLGVSYRVTEAVVYGGGGASFSIGDHGAADPDMYAAGIAGALNDNGEDVATADPTGWDLTAQDVVLTPNAGTFTSGKVKLRAYYLRTTATPAA
jgi:hypothetical protein